MNENYKAAKKILIALTLLLIFIFALVGNVKPRDENLMLVDLRVYYSDAGEFVTAPLRKLLEKFEAWKAYNPRIKISERKRIINTDIMSLAVLGIEHLPDVFITDSVTGRMLADFGFVFDLTEYAKPTETFTYNDKVYAFPVFREFSSVVIFDKTKWKKGDVIALGNRDGIAASVNLFSSMLSDKAGQEWFRHIVNKDRKTAFTDSFFVNRLENMKKLIQKGNFYGIEKNTSTIIQDFIEEKCFAVSLYGDDVYRLLERTKKQNTKLYERLDFTTLLFDFVPAGYNYGLFLNAQLRETPEKLKSCVELCRALTVFDKDKEENDETLKRLDFLIKNKTKTFLSEQYLSRYFWRIAREKCFSQISDNNKIIFELANNLQNFYEEYYMNVEDYSKKSISR